MVNLSGHFDRREKSVLLERKDFSSDKSGFEMTTKIDFTDNIVKRYFGYNLKFIEQRVCFVYFQLRKNYKEN